MGYNNRDSPQPICDSQARTTMAAGGLQALRLKEDGMERNGANERAGWKCMEFVVMCVVCAWAA